MMIKRILISISLFCPVILGAQTTYNFGLNRPQTEMPVSNAPFDHPDRKSPVSVKGGFDDAGCGEFILSEGWRMIEGHKMISQPVLDKKCDMSRWYNATVPGTVLTTLVDQGVYPDPYVGLNNLAIPDTLCRMDWWYRNEFNAPESGTGSHIKLVFNGINYRAQFWLNGVFLGNVSGAFKRAEFEVEDIMKRKGNILAVRILPPNNPGIPQEQTMKDFGNNGGMHCLDGPAFFASEGWDWMPGIRDRNIGIWQDVRLRYESAVSVASLNVVSDLALPDTTMADLTVRARLVNNDPVARTVEFKAVSELFDITETVNLAPSEIRELVFTSSDFQDLMVKNPKLWW